MRRISYAMRKLEALDKRTKPAPKMCIIFGDGPDRKGGCDKYPTCQNCDNKKLQVIFDAGDAGSIAK